jgi:hypothetical protein
VYIGSLHIYIYRVIVIFFLFSEIVISDAYWLDASLISVISDASCMDTSLISAISDASWLDMSLISAISDAYWIHASLFKDYQ